MIRSVLMLLPPLLLASCPPVAVTGTALPAAPDLETAAIARGLVADPARRDVVGLYARDTDRMCIVEEGLGYRVGVSIDFNDGIGCSARGTAARAAGALDLNFGGGCTMRADFDGTRIVLPAEVPAACARSCTRRATLSAVDVERVSDLAAEARTMRDARGRTPCLG